MRDQPGQSLIAFLFAGSFFYHAAIVGDGPTINQCLFIEINQSLIYNMSLLTIHAWHSLPGIVMNTFTIPDFRDIGDTIADCLASLGIAPDAQHERIVKNSLVPIALLFKAGEMACAAGEEERAVFAYFLSLMEVQARGFGLPDAADVAQEDGWRKST